MTDHGPRPTAPAEHRTRLLDRRTVVPKATLAFDLGVSERSVRRASDRRREADRPRSVTSCAADGDKPVDRLAVGRSMERFIASRIAAYERAALAGTDDEPERTARTVGHYARALSLIRAYMAEIEKDREDDAGPPARSLAELRDELRRHLERLWDESRAGERDRGA
ncbi:hypothetical protein [Enterovirga rhinocerotis]|uniref:hypothetical protein n=1 Tax=Enterovirga rhinocerotis TaxID=1339210 RepID=UPI00105B95F8|nr:hypothetical protein [Enterovirga rhinocerotis]